MKLTSELDIVDRLEKLAKGPIKETIEDAINEIHYHRGMRLIQHANGTQDLLRLHVLPRAGSTK